MDRTCSNFFFKPKNKYPPTSHSKYKNLPLLFWNYRSSSPLNSGAPDGLTHIQACGQVPKDVHSNISFPTGSSGALPLPRQSGVCPLVCAWSCKELVTNRMWPKRSWGVSEARPLMMWLLLWEWQHPHGSPDCTQSTAAWKPPRCEEAKISPGGSLT